MLGRKRNNPRKQVYLDCHGLSPKYDSDTGCGIISCCAYSRYGYSANPRFSRLVPGQADRRSKIAGSDLAAGVQLAGAVSESAKEMLVEIMNPCSEYAFQLAFSDSTILTPFLNEILGLEGDSSISTLTYLDRSLPSASYLGRQFVSDLLCVTGNGKYILIEMQNDFDKYYSDKALFELCRLTARIDAIQLKYEFEQRGVRPGEQSRQEEVYPRKDLCMKNFWKDVISSIVVVITNKVFPADCIKERFQNEPIMEPSVVNSYEMVNSDDHKRHLGNIEFKAVLVTLANFNKDINELKDKRDQWLYALKDPGLSTGKSRIDKFKIIDPLEKAVEGNEDVARFYKR